MGLENIKKERLLEEIVLLNDNASSLIGTLGLKKLKAQVNYKQNFETRVINNSGMMKHEKIDEYVVNRFDQFAGKLFSENYKKYPLVDLGTNGEAYISILAQNIGVPGVVATDVENQITQDSLNSLKESDKYENKNFPVLGLKIDMLELLKQLPNNSCNVSMFAIDGIIIASEKYENELFEQLYRVVPEEGVVISRNSVLDHLSKDKLEFLKWKHICDPEDDDVDVIFTKIKEVK